MQPFSILSQNQHFKIRHNFQNASFLKRFLVLLIQFKNTPVSWNEQNHDNLRLDLSFDHTKRNSRIK